MNTKLTDREAYLKAYAQGDFNRGLELEVEYHTKHDPKKAKELGIRSSSDIIRKCIEGDYKRHVAPIPYVFEGGIRD